MSLLLETEQFLHEQIPLSKAMGVAVDSYDGETLIVTAPLDVNHNHLGTAFGGSLSAIATLTGYALLWLQLGDRQCHIVVGKSSILYRHPVQGTINAICKRPESADLDAFKTKFNRVGKAKITLQVSVVENGRDCVEFEGVYVALKS